MTTQTTNFSGLLYYNPAAQGFNPVVSATTYCFANQPVAEGDSVLFTVITWNVDDGSSLYWRVGSLVNLTTSRFANTSGSITITDNHGSYNVQVSADATTATGSQSYDVIISRTLNGPALTTTTVTVGDTSQTAPGGNKVISLNPNYIALQGGNNIPNEVDSGSSAAALVSPFTGTLAQNGTLNFTGLDSALLLPAENVKTIGMWIKLTGQIGSPQYLLDSREINTGLGNGYIYSSGQDRWTSMSINGAPAGDSNWPAYWNTIVNNINNWQYVIVINQTAYTNSITLFNRNALGESLANVQVGWVEAWDYALNDSEINTAYLAHRTDYTISTPNALQITVGSVNQGGMSPNNNVTLSGVPNNQWTAIRTASSYVGKHGDNTTFSMTYSSDNDSGTFIFGVGTESSFQADSFWYVP